MDFHELHILIAKNNLIDNIDDLTTTISTLTSLRYLFLQGNPVTRFYRYRENLIANSVSIGKESLLKVQNVIPMWYYFFYQFIL